MNIYNLLNFIYNHSIKNSKTQNKIRLMKKVAVVIPVHNRLSYTLECLTILEQQRDTLFYKKNQVFTIVLDDGSTDNTSDNIRLKHPEVIVLQGNGHLWWSGSMNIAVKYALSELKCDFILLWENDIEPLPGYFDNLQLRLENWSENEIICSKIIYKVNPTVIFAMGGIFNIRTGFKKLVGRSQPDSEEYQQISEADWFCGQGILLHKSVFDTIGFFDEKIFPQYHGDSDFSLRATKSGFKNRFYPELKILNDTSITGISHVKNKTIRQFIDTLFSIRSNTNIIKDIQFYHRHTTRIFAYLPLLKRYFIYIGGYGKWKILGIFGINKNYDEFY